MDSETLTDNATPDPEPEEDATRAEIAREYLLQQRIHMILWNLIEGLSRFVKIFEQVIERPKFVDVETPQARFVFENPNPHILQVLMCVRVASGLRACMILLNEAHTTEVGVLFRTIDDFLADINFVDELIEKSRENVTEAQRQFVDNYFIDDARTIEERLEDVGKRRGINHNARRQKVQASEARLIGFDNPDRIKKITATVDDAFSGVVHGDYASSMEMYGGNPPHFHTRGMPVRYDGYRHHVGIYVHRALNMFCGVAHKLGLGDLAHEIRELRREFEKSPAYTYLRDANGEQPQSG